jgi:hypothetical protein
MKKVCFVLCLLFFCSFSFPFEIACSIPAGDFYQIPAKAYPIGMERLLKLIFTNEPYSMKFDQNYSIFRVFYNFDSTKMVETGFPNYAGVSYLESAAIDSDYFLSKAKEYFLISNINPAEIVIIREGEKTIYRTKPVEIEGIKILFDRDYAGEGVEMSVESPGEKNRVFLKAERHNLGEKVKITNQINIEKVLKTREILRDQKIVNLELFYTLSPEETYIPCAGVKTARGGLYYFDLLSGEEVKKYRVLTGR